MTYYKNINGELIELTAEEVAELEQKRAQAEAEEKRRPLTEGEAIGLFLRAKINTLEVDDETALRMKLFYPEWAVGVTYDVGFKLQYGDTLYRVVQAHTSQADWPPYTSTSLFTVIDEIHAGTLDDPIPYDGNMSLESGKYYSQDGVVYLCSRDTETAVYQPLADLVGLYVQVA